MVMDSDLVREKLEDQEWEQEQRYDSIANYLEKDRRIKKEVSRLKRLFKDIDESKKKLVQTTIEDVAFMTVTMQDLRENIIRTGTTVKYQNGANQYGIKQSPDAQLYLQMSQKQTQAMKILVDCMPKTERISKVQEDDFDSFVNERQDI